MDLLLSYSDSDPEDSAPEAECSGACGPTLTESIPSDFFGLNSSSSDEDTVMQHTSTDTLIDSYQLEDNPFGPLKPSENSPCEYSPRSYKRKRMADDKVVISKTRHWNSHVDVSLVRQKTPSVQDAISSLPADLFHVHPLISRLLATKATMPRLARDVKRVLSGHEGCVNTLHWGPQVNSNHLLLSASMDGSVRIWDALASKRACIWSRNGHGGTAVKCSRWCSVSHSVASGGYDKAVRMFDVERSSEIFSALHRHFVYCLKFHPTLPHLVFCGTLGSVDCWDVRESGSKPCKSYVGDFSEVQDIEFLRSGEQFLCCTNFVSRDSANKTIIAWDFRSGAVLSNQIFHERFHCTCLRSHPSENWFVAQTNGDYIAMFSATRPYKMNKKRRFEGHKVGGYWIGCDFSNDGQYLYSGSMDGIVYAYDFKSGKLRRTLQLSQQPCLAVDCHPVLQSTIAVSDWSGNIRICH